MLNAQQDNINYKTGDYTFKTIYDTNQYTTTLTIYHGRTVIYKEIHIGTIAGIKEYDLNNDGENEILTEEFSGGAHCCTSLYIGKILNNGFKVLDSIYWGNSFYTVKDLNNDGKLELSGTSDMFAYAFTNYAQSEFNVLIYGFENDKFVNVTSSFPEVIEKDIDDHIENLKPYIKDTTFECPENDTTDTFNTDAGAVKAILAPIVADYHSLGDVEKGYSYVDLIYKCPDKEKFIKILQNDYKLK